jgi:hypothetical protein
MFLELALASLHIYISWHAGTMSSDVAMQALGRSVAQMRESCDPHLTPGSHPAGTPGPSFCTEGRVLSEPTARSTVSGESTIDPPNFRAVGMR